ncbi:phosphatidylinositol 4,5-bisphosphate 3-kinase catalytic subunit delta isoform-like [Amphibalanus amphitrite]|uniref:phosphatidylinositol 4,5-bisphosphate 3-kinase catalytic subunit delta isoform-like n=1 Tax=Amphibalanus amphitrite TaxID=1232801 RepID=UPI001C8FED7D|nr:phosphatidylinositol 4,5-bisphosphate 3-kinase catalytic subunit delta isoform-like [Amphibalanus amphitrite]
MVQCFNSMNNLNSMMLNASLGGDGRPMEEYDSVLDPFGRDGWDSPDPDIHIECLMPSGIVVPLDVLKDATLETIKQKLWESEFPLHGTLRDMSQYVFQCVTPEAEAVELLDESCPLISVRPVFRVLRVIEREGDKHEKLLLSQIGNLIGKNMHAFEAHNNSAEVNEFRSSMRELCARVVAERDAFPWEQRVRYCYPCSVAWAQEMPLLLRKQLPSSGQIMVEVKPQWGRDGQPGGYTTLRVEPSITASELVTKVLKKMARSSQQALRNSAHSAHLQQPDVPKGYTLRVVGRQQYLVCDLALWKYAPVQEAMNRGERLRLQLVDNHSIELPDWGPHPGAEPGRCRALSVNTSTLQRRRHTPVSSWDIHQDFSLGINSLAHLQVGEGVTEIGLEIALFCGAKKLCESVWVSHPLDGGPLPDEDQELQVGATKQFEVEVRDLPRMTRLSLAVFEVARQERGFKSVRQDSGGKLFRNYLAWVNAPVYDYRGQLRQGTVTLYLWPYTEHMRAGEPLQPLSTVVANPDSETATQLSVQFSCYCEQPNRVVMYPSAEQMLLYAHQAPNGADRDSDFKHFGRTNTEQVKEELAKALENMRAFDLDDYSKEVVWSLRNTCKNMWPNALPKLLQCVDWSNGQEVAEMTKLLEDWQPLPPDKSLALLDVNVADPTVRRFAVRCLQQASDEELQLYLLQLVQALKHENYLFSELAEFLLERAIKSRLIGYWLFWHLRSETGVPCLNVRNTLILEAYCRAAPHHMHSLTRLHEALKTLKEITQKVKNGRTARKDRTMILESLKETVTTKHTLMDFMNPLDETIICGKIRWEDFTYFESKMAPLRLIFRNGDEGGDDVNLIFKSGDDLRQDMLTLQMIRIIDKLWKDQGLDLRLTPYGCISTDHEKGVIELVQEASTMANIYRKKVGGMFWKDTIYNWLRKHNTTDERLSRAVREFSLSCAGYSVITFVLGIADRHSDNIMVKKNGQMLHIDFGHILGHFKSKLGFRRERVPFVLTSDFVHVITECNKVAEAFEEFRQNCERAYMILRSHSDFIISLFGMMVSTGLPDVSEEEDLRFLHSTLRPDLPESEALKFFQEKFTEAQKKSTFASINNWFHAIKTDNNV